MLHGTNRHCLLTLYLLLVIDPASYVISYPGRDRYSPPEARRERKSFMRMGKSMNKGISDYLIDWIRYYNKNLRTVWIPNMLQNNSTSTKVTRPVKFISVLSDLAAPWIVTYFISIPIAKQIYQMGTLIGKYGYTEKLYDHLFNQTNLNKVNKTVEEEVPLTRLDQRRARRGKEPTLHTRKERERVIMYRRRQKQKQERAHMKMMKKQNKT